MSLIDVDEIQMLLGIKNKQNELKEFLSNKQDLTLLSAISSILTSPDINNFIKQDSIIVTEMYDDFISQLKLNKIKQIKIPQEQNQSNFSSAFFNQKKESQNVLHFSQEYLQSFSKFKEQPKETLQKIEVINSDNKNKTESLNNVRKNKPSNNYPSNNNNNKSKNNSNNGNKIMKSNSSKGNEPIIEEFPAVLEQRDEENMRNKKKKPKKKYYYNNGK